MVSAWDGRCTLDSSRDSFVEVRSPASINACGPFTLTFAFDDTDAEHPPDPGRTIDPRLLAGRRGWRPPRDDVRALLVRRLGEARCV